MSGIRRLLIANDIIESIYTALHSASKKAAKKLDMVFRWLEYNHSETIATIDGKPMHCCPSHPNISYLRNN